MLYVGLDVHSKQSSLCILNPAGRTVNGSRKRDINEQAVVNSEAGTSKAILPNIYPASAAAVPYHSIRRREGEDAVGGKQRSSTSSRPPVLAAA